MKRAASLLLPFGLLLALVLASVGADVRAQTNEAEAGPASGEQVFARSCAGCHGQEGRGLIAPALDGNLNLARADYVEAIILRGRDGMPPFADRLSGAEIAAVARYVRGAWGNDFVAEEVAEADTGASADDPESGGGDDEERVSLAAEWWQGADDAAALYERVCARCHGEDGGGGFGPPLVRNDNLGNVQYVAGKILHGQGGMPAFEGLLTNEQIALLATFVRNSFGNELQAVGVDQVRSLRSTPVVPGALRVSVFPGDARLSVVGPDRFVRFVSSGATTGGPVRMADLLPGSYTVTTTSDEYGPLVAEVEVLPLHETSLTLNLRTGLADETPSSAFSSVTAATEPATDVEAGGILYRRSCALCHGPEGGGGVGPALAGSSTLQNAGFVLDRILNGTSVMPAFANRLTPRQIAAIATFERSSWGNRFGEITTEQVVSQLAEVDAPDAPAPDSLASGPEIYEEFCAACHGGLGFGGVGPALQGNPALADLPYTVSRIVMGGGGMPSFHGILSTAEMAEIASFVRNAWGNEYGPAGVLRTQNYHGGTSGLQQ